jgi:hypothetical protein
LAAHAIPSAICMVLHPRGSLVGSSDRYRDHNIANSATTAAANNPFSPIPSAANGRARPLESGIQLLRAAFAEAATAESVTRLSAFIISATSPHTWQIASGLPAIEKPIVRYVRVKGETLLWRGAPGATAEAERHFRQALAMARQQSALSWELRAATSLARLWREQA